MDLNFIIRIIVGILIAVALYYIIVYLAKKFPTKESKLRFCPKCGSQNLNVNFKSFALSIAGQPEYVCKKCGLKSALFPIAKDEEELRKIQKKLNSP